jgi:hypothetical protein
MRCIICDSKMKYFFSKEFNYLNLKTVDYWKCVNCGFTASKTHYEMSQKEWEMLNLNFHLDHNLREDNPHNRNQRYFYQAQMIFLMNKFNLLGNGPFLDWGSGEGAVSSLSYNLFQIDILNFDKFIKPHLKQIFETELKTSDYNLVICNAVFEHVVNRNTLNEIESYVSKKGCFGIHTLIPENIPNNPEWMYLYPVHCSFHTNKSMDILMEQWGYRCSVYNEHSKMWFLFKNESKEIKIKVKLLNNALGWDYLKFKSGFMDFWK